MTSVRLKFFASEAKLWAHKHTFWLGYYVIMLNIYQNCCLFVICCYLEYWMSGGHYALEKVGGTLWSSV